MALSGSFSSGITGYTVRTDWVATQNIEENYSDITCDLWLICGSGYNLYTSSRTHTINIYGTPYPVTSSIATHGGQSLYLGSASQRVYHENDGTREVYLASNVHVKARIRGRYIENISGGSDTVTLDKIPRMSTIKGTMEGTRELGTPHTITILQQLTGNITHDVWYVLKGDNGESGWNYIARNTSDLNLTFTPSKDYNALQPNNNTIYMDIGCKTYKDGVQVGETTYSTDWYMKIPYNIIPTITNVEIDDLNTVAKGLGTYVQNQSKLQLKINAEGIEQSTIAKVQVFLNDFHYFAKYKDGSYFVETNVITASGDVEITIRATDTRDRNRELKKTINLLEYELPKIKKFVGDRTQTDQSIVKMNVDFAMSGLYGKNKTKWKIEKKKEKTDNWILDYSGTENILNLIDKLSFNNDENSRYSFRLTLNDSFVTDDSNSMIFEINSKFVLLSFHSSGTGFSVGRPAVKENLIEYHIPVYIKKIVGENWTKMHLYNSTKPYDAKNELKYFKDSFGLVHIQGVVKDTASEWLARITRVDCRPEKDLIVFVPCTSFKTAVLKIYEDGNILIENKSEISTNWISLDGITFKAKE